MNARRKKLDSLMKRNFNELSFSEQLDIISCKYNAKQKITYEEFVLIALSDEVEFFYEDKLYQIDHGKVGVTCIFVTVFNGDQKVTNHSEEFSSIIELLDNFRINGNRIRDIWDCVSL